MMKNLILPALLSLTGLGAGVAGGLALRPAPAEGEGAEQPAAERQATLDPASDSGPGEPPTERKAEYLKLDDQFVIPVVEADRVQALVLLSLSLEIASGSRDAVHEHLPKLRDALLRVLFDHANTGGFRGSFTASAPMAALRRALLEAAQSVLGRQTVFDVLIVDILRQDD